MSALHVDPLGPTEIADARVRAAIEAARAAGVPCDLFARISARAGGYAEPLVRALLISHVEGSVDHALKEMIRIRLARFACDPYFATLRSERARAAGLTEERIEAACGDYDSDPRFTERERSALRYADLMYRDPDLIDAAFYAALKQHYSEAEIMELGAFVAFHYGMQVCMRSLSVAPRSDP